MGSSGLIGLAPVFIERFALLAFVRRSQQPNVPIQRLSRTGVPQGWVCSASNSESLVPPQVPAWSPGSKTRDQGTLHCIDRSRLHRPSGRRRSQELRPCRQNRSFVSRVLAHYAALQAQAFINCNRNFLLGPKITLRGLNRRMPQLKQSSADNGSGSGKEEVFGVGYVVGGVFGVTLPTIRAGSLKRMFIAPVSPRLDSVPPHVVRSPEHVREAHQSHLRLQSSGASSLGTPIHRGWQELSRLPAVRNADRFQPRRLSIHHSRLSATQTPA